MQSDCSSTKVEYKSLDFLGFPNYRVGDDGTVWSKAWRYWRKLAICPDQGGYSHYVICNKVDRKTITGHRLVLEAFVGPCPDGMECCHENGKRADNRLTNLRWDTRLSNNVDKRKCGTTPKGEKNWGAKLTEKKVIEIRQLYHSGKFTRVQLQNVFMMSQSQINKIINRKSWSYV